MIPLKVILAEGKATPDWYGVAYVSWECNTRICYIIPLHLVVRLYRWINSFIKYPLWLPDRAYDAYKRGYAKGTHDLYNTAIRERMEKIRLDIERESLK